MFDGDHSARGYPSIYGAFASRTRTPARRGSFLTTNTHARRLTVAALYKSHRQAELFFKWIKATPRIKPFFGTRPNGVKSQFSCAAARSCRSPLGKLRLRLLSTACKFYTAIQTLVGLGSRKSPDFQCLDRSQNQGTSILNQLNLFNFLPVNWKSPVPPEAGMPQVGQLTVAAANFCHRVLSNTEHFAYSPRDLTRK